jgi:hypothetical protein
LGVSDAPPGYLEVRYQSTLFWASGFVRAWR